MRGGKLVKLAAAMTGVLLGGLFLLAWGLHPDDAAGPCVVANGPVMFPEIPETSGLAVGRRNPGLIWSHNDSGSAAVLVRARHRGAVQGRVRVPIATRDWEDVRPPAARRAIACISRTSATTSATPPGADLSRAGTSGGDAETAQPEVFTATYADGPHNAEAMFVVERISSSSPGIAPAESTGRHNAGQPRAHISTRRAAWIAAVTDAEASPRRCHREYLHAGGHAPG